MIVKALDFMNSRTHTSDVPQKATTNSTLPQRKAVARLTIVLPQDVADRLEDLHNSSGIPKVRLITNSLNQYFPAMEKTHA
jgi:hypothetical protein